MLPVNNTLIRRIWPASSWPRDSLSWVLILSSHWQYHNVRSLQFKILSLSYILWNGSRDTIFISLHNHLHASHEHAWNIVCIYHYSTKYTHPCRNWVTFSKWYLETFCNTTAFLQTKCPHHFCSKYYIIHKVPDN